MRWRRQRASTALALTRLQQVGLVTALLLVVFVAEAVSDLLRRCFLRLAMQPMTVIARQYVFGHVRHLGSNLPVYLYLLCLLHSAFWHVVAPSVSA